MEKNLRPSFISPHSDWWILIFHMGNILGEGQILTQVINLMLSIKHRMENPGFEHTKPAGTGPDLRHFQQTSPFKTSSLPHTTLTSHASYFRNEQLGLHLGIYPLEEEEDNDRLAPA